HAGVLNLWSYSWGGAPEFALFLTKSKRGVMMSDRRTLVPSDVVAFFDPKIGRMHHTMVVTRRSSDEVFLSGHTNDLLDEPLTGGTAGRGAARQRARAARSVRRSFITGPPMAFGGRRPKKRTGCGLYLTARVCGGGILPVRVRAATPAPAECRVPSVGVGTA